MANDKQEHKEVIARFMAAVEVAYDNGCNEEDLKRVVEKVCRRRDADASSY